MKSDSGSLGNLEIVAPSTSDVEFKYNWPVERFVKQVRNSGTKKILTTADFQENCLINTTPADEIK